MLGHLPYGDVPAELLAPAPPGFALNGCRVRAEVVPDLGRLLAAATAAGMDLRGLSCHRGLTRQGNVFCRERPNTAGDRAISVAPPGHSEHTTGFAIDFAIRPANGCPDAEACMAALPAYRWLRDNARGYGFEQSFPAGNRQGVKWEPWHWRWVGPDARAPGALRARTTFARARREFPADPGVVSPPPVIRTIAPPPPPPPPPAPEPKKRKRKR
jgi:zinc D-Ala-D-Ala carboxypeptidase